MKIDKENLQITIDINNISKRFGDKEVLKNVSIPIYKNLTTVILGLSGAGKSTIIKHIVKLLEPDNGAIYVDGVNVVTCNNKELFDIRYKVGYLFQSGALFDSKNVFDNISFPLVEHTKMSKEEIHKRVYELIELVDLKPEEVVNLFPDELSGGMKKRIGLARTIALNPQVILYDEPTSGLDPVTGEVISDLILKLQREIGATSILISHNMREAVKVGNYFAFLNEGNIIEQGFKEEFLNSPHKIIQDFMELG